jgi:uncharacterized membrane protein
MKNLDPYLNFPYTLHNGSQTKFETTKYLFFFSFSPTIEPMFWAISKTAFLASLPLVEQRLAIPMGHLSFDLPILLAATVGIVANIVSVGIVLWLLPIITKYCEKHHPPFHRFLQKIYTKTRTKHSHKLQLWGEIFLIFFVAVPLPGSGGWSGSLIAFLFGIPYRRAMKLISIGLIIGGILVAVLTVGINGAIQLIQDIPQEITEFVPKALP